MDANYTNWRSQEKEYFRNIYQSISTELVAEYLNMTTDKVAYIARLYKFKKSNDVQKGRRLVKLFVNDVEQHRAIVSNKKTIETINGWLKLYPKNKYLIYYTITI